MVLATLATGGIVATAMDRKWRRRNGWRWFGIVSLGILMLAIVVATILDFMRKPQDWVLGFGIVAAIVWVMWRVAGALYEELEEA